MWRNLFENHILKKGVSIGSNLINIEINKDITATFLGNQEYKLVISDDFSDMTCSCPCDGFYCKHLVALFSYLKDKQKRAFNRFWGSHLFNKAFDIKVKKEATRIYEEKNKLLNKQFENLKKENENLNLQLSKNVEKYKKIKLQNEEQNNQIKNLNVFIDKLKLDLKISKSNETDLNYKLNYYIQYFKSKGEIVSPIYQSRDYPIDDVKNVSHIDFEKQVNENLSVQQNKNIDKLNEIYSDYELADIGYVDSIQEELKFLREGAITFNGKILFGSFYYHIETETEYFYNPNTDIYYYKK